MASSEEFRRKISIRYSLIATSLRPEPHHLLLLLAEPVHAEAHDVAGLEEFRLRLHAERDAGRRAGEDHVAGLQHHELRAVPDQMGDAEHHRLGRASLPGLAVDREPHLELLRILDLVLGDQPRAERTESVAALALGPLARALDLEDALGHGVGEGIAADRLTA